MQHELCNMNSATSCKAAYFHAIADAFMEFVSLVISASIVIQHVYRLDCSMIVNSHCTYRVRPLSLTGVQFDVNYWNTMFAAN